MIAGLEIEGSDWALVALNSAGLLEKNQAHFIAAREKLLEPDLKVMELSAMSLSNVEKGVYLWPLETKSQWISSDRTMMLCFLQSWP